MSISPSSQRILSAHLFPSLRLVHAGVEARPPNRRSVERLLAYLLVHRGDTLDRRAVAADLWPDVEISLARKRLTNIIFHMRRHLDQIDADGGWVFHDRKELRWNSGSEYWLDCELLEDAYKEIGGGSQPVLPHQRRAEVIESVLDLCRGEPLSGIEDGWAERERDRLIRMRRELRSHLAGLYEDMGAFKEALGPARINVDEDPFDEAAHRKVMRLMLLDGDRLGAWLQFERCERILAQELGVRPSDATMQLADRLRHKRQPDFVLTRSEPSMLDGVFVPLPVMRIDRVDEQGRLRETTNLLESLRMVNLIGPAGVGKSCLAADAARAWQAEVSREIVWVDLASVERARVRWSSILEGLEDRLRAVDPVSSPRLLVLDNVDHFVDEVANWVLRALRRWPRLIVLSTSRERFNLTAERVYAVTPLSVPAPGTGLFTAAGRLSESAGLMSGLMTKTRFAGLDEQDRAGLAVLCRRLEGLPLALELAADALASRTLADLAEAVQKGDGPLGLERRYGPRRHRSLRAALDWSYRRVPLSERRLLRRLASSERSMALNEVVGSNVAPVDSSTDLGTIEALDDIGRLAARSWLTVRAQDPQGSMVVLSDLHRQYLIERLVDDPDTQVGGAPHSM